MIYVMLPAYNEEAGIGKVLEKLPEIAKEAREPLRTVVVDDGSRDRTVEVAKTFERKLDMRIFSFGENRGVGEVFKTGFRFACEDSRDPRGDICVVLDSDNTQDPCVMLAMIRKIKEGQDLVVASRFETGGKMVGCPFRRQIFSYGISWMLRLLVRLPHVKDYSTFYRAYRVSLLRAGFERYGERLLEGKGFAVAGGLLLKLGNLTRRICEVPLVLRYDLNGGASGAKIFKTIRGYLALIWEYGATNGYRNLPAGPVL